MVYPSEDGDYLPAIDLFAVLIPLLSPHHVSSISPNELAHLFEILFVPLRRPRVPSLSVSVTPRPTLPAEDAVRCLSTSRRRPALRAATLLPRPDHVSISPVC